MSRAPWVLPLMLGLVACGGDDAPDETTPFEIVPIGNPATATIGAAGGTIVSSDQHLALRFPPGSLASDTQISIQQIAVDDGWGWSLLPQGMPFAAPPTAILSFSRTEISTPSSGITGNDVTVTLPVLDVLQPGAEATGFSAALSADSAKIELTAPLARLSDLIVTRSFDFTFVHPRRIAVGETFPLRVLAPVAEAAEPHRFYLSCPDRGGERVLVTAARTRPTTFDPLATTSFAPAGPTMPVQGLFGTEGLERRVTCKQASTLVRTETTSMYERSATAPWPTGCTAPQTLIGQVLPIDCRGGPCTSSDPLDLSLDPDGDAALDLTCAQTGVVPQATAARFGGGSWVTVGFERFWKPADHHAWYSKVVFDDATGPIGSITVERRAGAFGIVKEGVAATAELTLNTAGYTVLFYPATPNQVTTLTVESGVQKTATSPVVVDTMPPFAFDATPRDL